MRVSNDVLVISVDDHLVQPPDLWEKRLPARYRDRGPRVVEGAGGNPADVVARFAGKGSAADGKAAAAAFAAVATATPGDAWVYDGDVFPTTGASAAAGVPADQYSPFPFSYRALPPEYTDPVARTKAMDQDGVLASVCFPMSEFPRFCGQSFLEAKDRDLALLCVQAFNDFMLEEWYAAAPTRFIPLVILPLWDPQLAQTEIYRTVERGARGIAFSEDPFKLGLPSIHGSHWDPVFAAAAETDTPLCTHIGSGSWVPPVAPDAPLTVNLADLGMIAAGTATNWLLSDVFLRFPNLKLVLSEGGIGWVPYTLSRVDYAWERHGLWTRTKHKEPPSRQFRTNVFGCFIDDPVGAAAVREIGVENCMLESDYPHSDTSWPNTLTMARERLGYLDADEFALVAQGNARRLFRFEPSP